MTNIKNASDLYLHPAGVPVRPGATVAIDDRRWKQYAGTPEGKNLLRMAMIEEAAPVAKPVKRKPRAAKNDAPEAQPETE